MTKTKETVANVQPFEVYCTSHGLNNAGKKLKGAAPYAEYFRKLWQPIVQYRGKARDYTRLKFNEKVNLSAGVRFFVQFEQIKQVSKHGLKVAIIDDIVPKCIDEKWSENSAIRMNEEFGQNEKKAELGMAIIESAAVADAGLIPCMATYAFEGDSPLVLIAHELFKSVEVVILDDDGGKTENIERVVDEALQLILEAKVHFATPKDELVNALAVSEEVVDRSSTVLHELLATKESLTSGSNSRSGRQRRLTNRLVDGDALDDVNIKISNAKITLKDAKEERNYTT